MKYVYCFLLLVLVLGGYLLYTQSDVKTIHGVPEGSHTLPDGTVIKNDTPEIETTEQQTTSPEQIETKKNQTDPSKQVVTLDPNAHQFTISAINYAYDVTEMRVKKGETVTVSFKSTDGFHDWVVDEFNAYTQQVSPGQLTSVTFVADKAGTFEYYCSVGQHRLHGMVGKFIVEE